MDIFVLSLRTLAPLFALIALGYGLRHWSILRHEHVPVLNSLVVNVLLPATVIRALLQAPSLGFAEFRLPLVILAGEAILCGGVYLLGRKVPRNVLGATMLTAAFGNTGFLGFPIVLALLPRQFASAVLIDECGMMLALYPLAAVLASLLTASQDGQESVGAAFRRFLRSPLLIALASGIVLRLLPLPAGLAQVDWIAPLWHVVDQTTGYLAQATTPVVLIALGLALEPRAGEGPPALLATVCGLKLVLLPAIVYAIAILCGIRGEPLVVLVLEAAMPSAVVSGVLSQQYGLGGKFAVRAICLSTLLAALTLPVVLYLVH